MKNLEIFTLPTLDLSTAYHRLITKTLTADLNRGVILEILLVPRCDLEIPQGPIELAV